MDEPWQERKAPRVNMIMCYKVGERHRQSVTDSLEVAWKLNGNNFRNEEESEKAFSCGVKDLLALEENGLETVGLVNRHAVEAGPEEQHEEDQTWVECWDEVLGKPLNPELVKKERQEEIGFFRRKGVYKKAPAKEAWGNTDGSNKGQVGRCQQRG